MGEELTIWKSSAVGVSTGVSLRCNDCGVILSNMEAPDGITGRATVFCPRCQKTTMATAFAFCTGSKEPFKVADGDRRFMVCEGAKTAEATHKATGIPIAVMKTPNAEVSRSAPLLAQVGSTDGLDDGGKSEN